MEGKSDLMTLKDKMSNDQIRPANQRQFLYKLFALLEENECEEIISWSSDGQSVVLKDLDLVSEVVLPKYFNSCKYPSFIRQLNYYGFKKATKDIDTRAYSHEFFKKGRMYKNTLLLAIKPCLSELLVHIKRLTRKNEIHTGRESEGELSLQKFDSEENLLNYEKQGLLLELKMATFIIDDLRRENYRLRHFLNERNQKQQMINFNSELHHRFTSSPFQPAQGDDNIPAYSRTSNSCLPAENPYIQYDNQNSENSPTSYMSYFNTDFEASRFTGTASFQKSEIDGQMFPTPERPRFITSYQTPKHLDQEFCFNQALRADF